MTWRQPLRLFSTFPPSSSVVPDGYLSAISDVARWSEAAGFVGGLVYTDNSLLDPWVVALAIIGVTQQLAPLIAVQPVYMHPYAVAKLVTSIVRLHGRRLFLNMVAGGFVNDLAAMNDFTDHDARYERLVEHTLMIKALLADEGPVTTSGRWYASTNLRLTPSIPRDYQPGFTVSGSSVAGMAAARALGATAIQYPKPVAEYEGSHELDTDDKGIRIGILTRPEAIEAWRAAWSRFPEDRRGRFTHRMAMMTSDSVWHRQLSALAEGSASLGNTYWLHPFENYKTFCPYLVGSYDEVARAIAEYLSLGYRTFITDVPLDEDDLVHTAIAFDRARELTAA
jgi:alkanesulfonate monooxygenase